MFMGKGKGQFSPPYLERHEKWDPQSALVPRI